LSIFALYFFFIILVDVYFFNLGLLPMKMIDTVDHTCMIVIGKKNHA
jgi:hypothetical protein